MPTFGVPLALQMARDGVEHPRILTKCAAAIEKHGLNNVGIYRLSGTMSRVKELKNLLDRGMFLFSFIHLRKLHINWFIL